MPLRSARDQPPGITLSLQSQNPENSGASNVLNQKTPRMAVTCAGESAKAVLIAPWACGHFSGKVGDSLGFRGLEVVSCQPTPPPDP